MSETTNPPVAEGGRGIPTKKDVTALLQQFEPAPVAQPSAAERERDKRIEKARAAVRACAKSFEELGVTAGDAAKAAAALKGLLTAQKHATAAIEGLSPRQLGVDGDEAPKTTRNRRQSKAAATGPVKIEEPVPTLPSAPPVAPKPATEPDAPEEPAEDDGAAVLQEQQVTEQETPEQMVERLKAERAARGAPTTAPHRSGPAYATAASGDIRGDVDPNEGDGF